MKIGIIDADLLDNGTRHPNLALMKISGYFKSLGNEVELLQDYKSVNEYAQIYISKVFTFTKVPDGIVDRPNVHIGGTGFFEDGGTNLPYEIEHHMPDYSLYEAYANDKLAKGYNRSSVSDYLDFSIGFTTRGCFRKCSFCVNKKYDRPFKHSPVSEFLDNNRPYIYLWDDNFLAFSGWESILDELEATGKPFQFRQGLDVRLMTDQKVKRLSKTRYHGDFIFAFDHLEDRDLIESKLKLWRKYCAKTTKLYVLCAYNSQDEKDIEDTFERIHILMKYGCLPYIMRYELYKKSRWETFYVQLARWCNQPQFFKKKSFRQFCEANQDYHKNKNTVCAAYQCMKDFEENFPDIAKKYFDLRFEEENKYGNSFGYGRKYANKQNCEECSKQQATWEDAYNDVMPLTAVLKKYYEKEMDFQCLLYADKACINYSSSVIAEWFCNQLITIPLEFIFESIKSNPCSEDITPSNIPQFSNFEDAYIETLDILVKSKSSMKYDELGKYLDNGKDKNVVAQRKYGENHSKMAALLDLTVITQQNSNYVVSTSVFGQAVYKLSSDDRKRIVAHLLFRVPIIQKLLTDASSSIVNIDDELACLSEQTRKRRRPNIVAIIQFIHQNTVDSDLSLREAINNIRGWQ